MKTSKQTAAILVSFPYSLPSTTLIAAGLAAIPDSFDESELLLEEARYFELSPLVRALEHRPRRGGKRQNGGSVRYSPPGGECLVDCVAMSVSPDLGERIALSGDRILLEEVFPELSSAIAEHRGSGGAWSLESRFLIRFPLNGYCKLNSLQVRSFCCSFVSYVTH